VVLAVGEPELLLLTDGKDHLVAVAVKDTRSRLYYGDGKTLWEVAVDPGENTGPMPDGSWKRLFLDPRFPSRRHLKDWRDLSRSLTQIVFEGGAYRAQCGERSTPLSPVPPAQAQKILAAAQRKTPERVRAYALARDDRGRYYYVDRGDTRESEKRFRVFAGEKGALRRLKMVNVVSDSEGDLFATATGELRLVLDKKEVAWIEGETRRRLTLVPVEENLPLIWNELGVYSGEAQHTPCDDL
jgi:hypothetical protein